MNNEFINLLPPERQQALSRDYFMRVGVVAALMITALVIVAAALRVPNYTFLTKSMAAKQARLANVEAILSASNEAALSARLTVLSGEAEQIIALKNVPYASATLRSVLAVPRSGIALTSFKYVRANGKTPGTLVLSGIAETRDSLRAYQVELQNAPFAAAANLPVSAYAKDVSIPFVITVTLAP